jgi:hypothetical protein
MRAIILILILAVVALIAAIQTGFLDIRQTRGAEAPDVAANASGVTATGGQAPAFDVETGKIAIGSKDKNLTVQVPAIEVKRPSETNQSEATTNAAN